MSKTYGLPEACLICSKEKEIESIHAKIIDVSERFVRIETIITSLHAKISGNGRMGMWQEWQQFKGAWKMISFFVIVGSGIFAAIVTFILNKFF